jgi:hypothetical protein
MKRGEFYTHYLVDEKHEARKIDGFVDKKLGIGIYKRDSNTWFSIDLRTGLSAYRADTKQELLDKLKCGMEKVDDFRSRQDYEALCEGFSMMIKESQDAETGEMEAAK